MTEFHKAMLAKIKTWRETPSRLTATYLRTALPELFRAYEQALQDVESRDKLIEAQGTENDRLRMELLQSQDAFNCLTTPQVAPGPAWPSGPAMPR
jgi:hypothetical protein